MQLLARALLLYRTHLAQFLLFRLLKSLALLAYHVSYRLRSALAKRPESGCYYWCSLSNLGADFCQTQLTAIPGEAIGIPAPTFFGHGAVDAATPSLNIFAPEIKLYEFSPAMVVGGVDFVFTNNTAIHHDLYDPLLHPCPAQEFGVISPWGKFHGTKLNSTQLALQVDAAATLIGQCSFNYAHWLTETLPKLAVLDSTDKYSDLPLLVDDALHPNIMASIQMINQNHRPVIRVKRWQPVHLRRLVTISSPGYEPYFPIGIKLVDPAPYSNTFSYAALSMLRRSVAAVQCDDLRLGAKRVYLARSALNSNLREIENAGEIENILREHDLQIAVPESLSFQEQVATCVDAELIVAHIGAALANMIFAPPGCRIVVLAPYYVGASYSYYTNLAGVLGHKLTYVLGPQVGARRHPRQRNYRIDLSELQGALHG